MEINLCDKALYARKLTINGFHKLVKAGYEDGYFPCKHDRCYDLFRDIEGYLCSFYTDRILHARQYIKGFSDQALKELYGH